MLLDRFSPDIEQEGEVKFDGYLIEGASPLWCAAGTNILNDSLVLQKFQSFDILRSWTLESGQGFGSGWS